MSGFGDERHTQTGNVDPLTAAVGWLNAGHRVALATVIKTWEASPRPVGAVMAINNIGDFAGSVSEGCVEAAVIHEAMKCLDDDEVRFLRFSITDDQAWTAGLAGGGKLEIYLEPIEGAP